MPEPVTKDEFPQLLQLTGSKHLIDAVPFALFTYDLNGFIADENRQCAALLGRSVGRRIWDVCELRVADGSPLDPAQTPIMEALRRGAAVEASELILERPDGTRSFVEVHASPILDSNAAVVGGLCSVRDVSKRKAVDAERETECQTLAGVFSTTPACIKIVARDGTLLRMNESGLNLIDADEEAIGKSVFDLIAPEYLSEWRANNARVCNGERLTWEFEIVGRSGKRRSMETKAAPISLQNGEIAHLAVTTDITQRKLKDRRIRESDHYYRQILDALPVAVYTTDAVGKITFYNCAAVKLAGREPQLGADEWCITGRLLDRDGVAIPHDQCPMANALRKRQAVIGPEMIAERPDGSHARFEPHMTPIFDSEGNLAGGINLLIEVTARHEEEIQAARLAAIVASSDDAIVSKTLDGYVTSWNAGATRIFGFTAEEMIGQHITRIIPEDLRTEEDGILARLRAGDHVDHFETVRVGKDGRRIDVSLTVSPMRDKSGRVIGASKVGRDISDRKQSEKLQRLLISELNHRVKNTLATVQSIANQTVTYSQNMTDFATSFGGRLQALARTHSLLTETTWRGAELSAVIRDQMRFGGAGEDRITYSGPSVMLHAQAALHLGLVLHELVTNALKYGSLSTPNGTAEIRWIVRHDDGRQLLLQWQERNGPRVTAPQKQGFGTLLIERSLDAHGGSAVVRYQHDGVVCDIKLPLPESEYSGGSYSQSLTAAESPRVKAPQKATPVGGGLVGKRILVVDDEPLIAMDIIANLSDEGCEIVGPAATVDKALELIEEMRIDAALLDANLAGDPVDTLAAALVKRHVPFAFVSGYGRENLPAAFRDVELVRKPFQPQVLIDTVRQLVKPEDNVVPLRVNV